MAENTLRVLLVEDDRMIGDAAQSALHDEAYAVDWVCDGDAAITACAAHNYDMILLDLGLPKRDGLDVLRHLRKSSNASGTPVVIVSARDALEQRLEGLDLGADDYIVKPFDMRELVARMRAVSRRKQSQSSPVLSNGYISLDPVTRSATTPERSEQLSAREFALLRALLVRPGAILSRSELEERIYGWNEEVVSNAVEFLIHGLRKKLGKTAIKNVRGLGWMVPKEE